ncbi:MucBP domain-containing protein, partial [Paenibacillus popilliae]
MVITKWCSITAKLNQEIKPVTVKLYKQGTTEELTPKFPHQVEEIGVEFTAYGPRFPIVGAEITANAPEVEGFQPEQAEMPYKVVDGDNEIVFYYSEIKPVTVKLYKQGTTEELKPQREPAPIIDIVGAEITVTAPEVDGFQPERATMPYKVVDGDNEVVFYYSEIKPVTVKLYKQGTTEELTPKAPVEVKGNVGAEITVNAPEVDGFQPEKAKMEYKVEDGDNEVVFYYSEIKPVNVKLYKQGTTEELKPKAPAEVK